VVWLHDGRVTHQIATHNARKQSLR
jgi:hypothetical protein